MSQQVVITGAGGFVGQRLLDALFADPRFTDAHFTLTDLKLPSAKQHARVRLVTGDLSDAPTRAEVLAAKPTLVYHLAGIMGGAAEANYELSRRVNVDATLSFFEDLRTQNNAARVVFTSSIAVFGPTLPELVNDDTIPCPAMIYGAQKLMLEVALQQFSNRGWVDGIAVRLPGIVARDGANPQLKSAFLNRIFYAYKNGEDFIMPVSPDGHTWLLSVYQCVQSLVHAGTLPASSLGERRAFTLPAQRVRTGDLVAHLGKAFPQSRSVIEYNSEPALQAQFASSPRLRTELADALGFVHDGDLDALIANAFLA